MIEAFKRDHQKEQVDDQKENIITLEVIINLSFIKGTTQTHSMDWNYQRWRIKESISNSKIKEIRTICKHERLQSFLRLKYI